MWAQRICGLDFLPEEIHVRGFFDLFNRHRLLCQFSCYDTKGMSFAFVLQIFWVISLTIRLQSSWFVLDKVKVIFTEHYSPKPYKTANILQSPTGFPVKCCSRNDCRNSILITCHYTDLGSVYDCLKQISLEAQPIKITSQIIMDFLQSVFKLHLGNQWCCELMSTVFSDYTFLSLFYVPWTQAHRLLSFKYMDRSVIILTEATIIIPVMLVIVILIFLKVAFWFFGCTKIVAIEVKSPYGSCWTKSSCRVVYYTFKRGSTFWVCQWNPLSSNFLWWRWW